MLLKPFFPLVPFTIHPIIRPLRKEFFARFLQVISVVQLLEVFIEKKEGVPAGISWSVIRFWP